MKYIAKKTEGTAIVKVGGTTFTETITLATDLLVPSQTISGGAFNVGIQHLQWVTTNAGEKITITRNGQVVIELMGQGTMDLSGNGGFIDSQESASDLVCTGTGWLYISLRKTAGYSTKIETWKFGQYDNTTVVGS